MPQLPHTHVPVCVCVSTHCSWSCNYPSFFGTILTTSLNVGAALSKTQPQSHFQTQIACCLRVVAVVVALVLLVVGGMKQVHL